MLGGGEGGGGGGGGVVAGSTTFTGAAWCGFTLTMRRTAGFAGVRWVLAGRRCARAAVAFAVSAEAGFGVIPRMPTRPTNAAATDPQAASLIRRSDQRRRARARSVIVWLIRRQPPNVLPRDRAERFRRHPVCAARTLRRAPVCGQRVGGVWRHLRADQVHRSGTPRTLSPARPRVPPQRAWRSACSNLSHPRIVWKPHRSRTGQSEVDRLRSGAAGSLRSEPLRAGLLSHPRSSSTP